VTQGGVTQAGVTQAGVAQAGATQMDVTQVGVTVDVFRQANVAVVHWVKTSPMIV